MDFSVKAESTTLINLNEKDFTMPICQFLQHKVADPDNTLSGLSGFTTRNIETLNKYSCFKRVLEQVIQTIILSKFLRTFQNTYKRLQITDQNYSFNKHDSRPYLDLGPTLTFLYLTVRHLIHTEQGETLVLTHICLKVYQSDAAFHKCSRKF